MNKAIKKIIKSSFIGGIIESYLEPYRNRISNLEQMTRCYSQEGEDLILDTFLHDEKNGFFVDIGAYHPIKYSNTYLFYLKGWRGINIDARPSSMDLFNKIRPNDINLEVAIGERNETLTYYMFDEPGLNGFSKELSEDRHNSTTYKIINQVQLPLSRLSDILEAHVPHDKVISFMSIDVEGLDFQVLNSNNWTRFRPKMILVETSIISEGIDLSSPIHQFLIDKSYLLVAKTYRTSFYKRV